MRLNIHGVETTDQIYLGIAEIQPDCCRTGVAFFCAGIRWRPVEDERSHKKRLLIFFLHPDKLDSCESRRESLLQVANTPGQLERSISFLADQHPRLQIFQFRISGIEERIQIEILASLASDRTREQEGFFFSLRKMMAEGNNAVHGIAKKSKYPDIIHVGIPNDQWSMPSEQFYRAAPNRIHRAQSIQTHGIGFGILENEHALRGIKPV